MKVLRKIGNFFRSIWRYIKQNAWIQPILMVGLIFAIIFGLTKAEAVWNTIKGWFTTDSTEPQYVEIFDGEDHKGTQKLISKFEKGDTFVVIFGGSECSYCAQFNEKVLNVFLENKVGKQYRDDIYYYYSQDYIDYLQDLVEDNEEKAYKYAVEYDEKLMTQYIDAYNYWEDSDYRDTESSNYLSIAKHNFWAAETPTILYVVDGEVMGYLYGDISNVSNSLVRFDETLAAWKLAQEDFEAGKTAFKEALDFIG